MKIFASVITFFLIGFVADLASAKINCGIKCYRWEKCMKQVSGHDSRPGQLGNTGQLVLNTCDTGDCDCTKIVESSKETTRTGSTKVKTSSSVATTSEAPAPVKSVGGLRRPPRLVRNRNVQPAVEAVEEPAPVVSVTSSVSSSSSQPESKLTPNRLRYLRRKVSA